MIQGEPSSASKIVKIAHQQTLGLLLFNCYCLVLEYLTRYESRSRSLLFFLMTADPPLFFSCLIFLVNPLPTSVYFYL
jgi:hypothetical protein